jgi:hypothetical protein
VFDRPEIVAENPEAKHTSVNGLPAGGAITTFVQSAGYKSEQASSSGVQLRPLIAILRPIHHDRLISLEVANANLAESPQAIALLRACVWRAVVANDANIVTRGLHCMGKRNVGKLQVALTVMICGRDNRRRTAESTPVRGGSLCRQMPSLLPVISLSPNYLAKTKRCCCVSSRVNAGTCWNPPPAPPKIFNESCLPTTTTRRPDQLPARPERRSPIFVDKSRAMGNKRRI